MQLSFERGMVETIKQDTDSELSQPHTSVLWLENFNPNIVAGAVVKRSGEGASENVPTVSFKYPGSDLYPPQEYYDEAPVKIYSSTSMEVRSPFSSHAHIVFYDQYFTEDVYVSTKAKVYAYHYEDNNLIETWKDVKGYRVPGELTDYSRYGQSMLFTTLPINSFDGASPVYRMYFWDGTKYWENGKRFLNGYLNEDYATDKERWCRWIIAKPTQSVALESLGVYRLDERTYEGKLSLKNIETNNYSLASMDAEDFNDLIKENIAVVIWEQPSKIVKVDLSLDGTGSHDDKGTMLLYADPYHIDKIKAGADGRIAQIKSYEYLNEAAKTTIWQGKLWNGDKNSYMSDALPATVVRSEWITAWEEDENAFIPRFTQPYNAAAEFYIAAVSGGAWDAFVMQARTGWYRAKVKVNDKLTGTFSDKNLIVSTEYQLCANNKSNRLTVSMTSLCEVGLEDYLNLRIPRSFLAGEKIPMLVVGRINGVNVLLKSFTYNVKGNARNLNPTRKYLPEGNGAEFHFGTAPQNVGAINHLPNFHQFVFHDELNDLYKIKPLVNTRRFTVSLGEEHDGLFSNLSWYPQASLISGLITTPNNYPDNYYSSALGAAPAPSTVTQDYRKDCPTTEQGANRSEVVMKNLHKTGNNVYVTITIKTDEIYKLVEAGLSSISIYAAKPNTSEHLLYSRGLTFEPMDGTQYALPKKLIDKNYSDFALIKEFQIHGNFNYIETYNDYEGEPITTNCWQPFGAERLIAVPMHANNMPNPGAAFPKSEPVVYTPHFILDSMQRQNPYYLPKSNPGYQFDDLRVDVTKAYDGIQFEKDKTNSYKDIPINDYQELDKLKVWSPDFCIWDYPTSQSLILDSSGEYWDGIGARCICVIKGRVFIGGTINKDLTEEQAIIRYSDVQAGVISQDIFSLENKLIVGHNPTTALAEYREQLWVFSNYDLYRLQMPSITDVTTWEFLDVIQQGTFSPKTAIVTPYGVVFANSGGVWITDGGLPENLAVPILGSYQQMANGNYYNYMFDSKEFIYEIDGWNKNMEVVYDKFKDELLILSLATEKGKTIHNAEDPHYIVKFIFSFQYKNWRVETSLLPTLEDERNQYVLPLVESKWHRIFFSKPEISHGYRVDGNFRFLKEYKNLSQDMWMENSVLKDIQGEVIFHEQGNGKDDYLLQRVIAEISPTPEGVVSEYLSPNEDPVLDISLRNSIYMGDVIEQTTNPYTNFDLVKNNMLAKKGRNPFISAMQTPNEPNDFSGDKVKASTEQRWNQNGLVGYTARESLILLAPLNSKFRRMRMKFKSKLTAVIRSFTLYIIEKKRRGYG